MKKTDESLDVMMRARAWRKQGSSLARCGLAIMVEEIQKAREEHPKKIRTSPGHR